MSKPFTPPLSNRFITEEKQFIFTCFSNCCEWSACSQVRFGSSASPMVSFDDCPQRQWLGCGQCCKPARLDLYCCWFDSPKAALWTCTSWTERMEHMFDGGRTIVCELGCPFRVCGAYFSASPAFFSASFVLFRFSFVEIEVISVEG